jgi:chromosome segregation ATPase
MAYNPSTARLGRKEDLQMTNNEIEQVLHHFDAKAVETQRHFDEKAAETQHHFDIVTEELHSQIQTVAEGVLAVGQRLERHAEAMRAEFAEVRAMIKFSYSELDRRLTTVEATVNDLTARLERLESRIS